VYTAFDGYLTVDAGTLVPAETVAAHAAAAWANSAASGGVTNG
jgi:hypothetical protein